MAKKSRGFGATHAQHGINFRGRLWALEKSLDSTERVLRGGDCHAAVDTFAQAFEEWGEVESHRRSGAISTVEERARLQHAFVRLNHLRQAMKRCVR